MRKPHFFLYFMKGSSFQSQILLDYTCNYSLAPFVSIEYGWNCVTNMEPYRTNFVEHSGENQTDCSVICAENGARQPSYEDFLSLNTTTLSNLCYDR